MAMRGIDRSTTSSMRPDKAVLVHSNAVFRNAHRHKLIGRRALLVSPQCSSASSKHNTHSAATLSVAQQPTSEHPFVHAVKAGAVAAILGTALLLSSGPAYSKTDVAKVGTCLLKDCQGALAKCLGDGTCLKDLVCLQKCNNRPDEIACQLRCGDLYADEAIDVFNACAVSNKKCVAQTPDFGDYPVPPDCALDKNFDLANFQDRWYITAGLNPLFDTFDCQVHYFGVPEPGKMYAKINWRVTKPDSDWIQRETVQRFVQDDQNPAVLYNHDNEYLHYQDDWYVVASKPDQYVFVYYRGSNDAWKGYGGAVIYTKASSLPAEYIPELQAAAESVGLKWDQFILTNNSCPPHPPKKTIIEELEQDVEKVERFAVTEVQAIEENLVSFGRGFTQLGESLEKKLDKELTAEERLVRRELEDAAQFLQKIEQKIEGPSFLKYLPFKLPF